MASPRFVAASFQAQSRRISIQLANLGRRLAYSVSASWSQLQQEPSGSQSVYRSTESFERREERRGPDTRTPGDTSSSCAAEAPHAISGGSSSKSSQKRHRRRTVTGYARHAALVIVFLMICVALAVLIAYRMTFGSEEVFATTHGVRQEAYPNIVVPNLREATESLSEFEKWIRDLLDKVEQTPRNFTVPEDTYEEATPEASSDAANETTSIASTEEASSTTFEETLMTTGNETVNGSSDAANETTSIASTEEASNTTFEETLMTTGNETVNGSAVTA
ncbi:hypothetical protein V5799_029458 [Amblyomma americanum]|uniref:Transmembrane protein n=1 Tax=Amblyomma americanum TaxID=6943 RepID=A0AAQ4ERP8_AMBAM